MINICFFTSSRAEYGILKNLIVRLKKDKKLKIYIVVTGSHLSKFFGNTIDEIKNDKINIDKLINFKIKKNNPKEILENMSGILREFSYFYEKKKIDLLIVLGDRVELLPPVIASLLYKIPVCHIHGGEKTLSAIDDNVRHAISKLSFFHLVSTRESKKRLIQLGENKKNIFNIGSLMLDSYKKKFFLSPEKIQKAILRPLKKVNFLITIHPETHLSKIENIRNLKILLSSLSKFPDYLFVFTATNSDVLGVIYNETIKKFVKKNPTNCLFIKSMGSLLYLSFANISNGVLGNSSSGIIEIPSLGVTTLNLGMRQTGRVASKSIINCNFDKNKICHNIKKMSYMKKCLRKNPYYKKNSISNAVKIITKFNYKKNLIKNFHDII
jgi:UDP-hydrolysing UDP-N-acetyl-D-glucosamine 2-epimerase